MSVPAEKITLNTGIFPDIPNAAYHADKTTYSSSIIKLMDVPAQAKHRMDNPSEYKECFRIGSAIHKYILEPADFQSEFLTGIDCARRSKADKTEWAQWFFENGADGDHIVSHAAGKWNELFELQTNKHMVTPEEIKEIGLMAESVKSNKNAIRLLEGGLPEQSVYWQDDETGLLLRCRPDYMSDDFIVDLKTIDAVDDRSISIAISKFGYALQDGMYSHGCHVASGKYRPFVFLFLQKSSPFLCRVICLNEEEKARGWEKYTAHKQRLAECLASGEWPGPPDDLDFGLFERKV